MRAVPIVALLALGLAAAMLVGSMVGPYPIPAGDVIGALVARLRGDAYAPHIDTILFQIRMPRVLAAALVGAALAAAGASYQTLFRNPLVSPDILGVSAGAGFGAVLGILLSLPVISTLR